MKEEVWVWLPWDHRGAVTTGFVELLQEARALCVRMGTRLLVRSDRNPGQDIIEVVGRYGGEIEVVSAKDQAVGQKSADVLMPRLYLFSADAHGRMAAPFWSAAQKITYVSNLDGITTNGSSFVTSKRILGEQGELVEDFPLDQPLVASLIPDSIGVVDSLDFSSLTPGDPVGKIIDPEPSTVEISEAERIVAFGRGAFSEQGMKLVKGLANALGAAIAGTRPAADEGWIPFHRQIGLTGAVVKPRLYVALGISGAPYHLVGVKGAEKLICINADPAAPIFGQASLGIVGDLYQVVPGLLEELSSGSGIRLSDGSFIKGKRGLESEC